MRKNMNLGRITFAGILIGMAFLTGCNKGGTGGTVPEPNNTQEVSEETNNSSEEDGGYKDITYEQVSQSQYDKGEFGFTMSIDEDEAVVLTICRGEKGSGGYDISVESVKGNDEEVIVTVLETNPEGVATAVITYPSCTVRIPDCPSSIKVVKVVNTEGVEYPYHKTSILDQDGVIPQIQPRRRMVCINGNLYLDTGYVSGVWGRCGNLDGNITKVIDQTQTPGEDGCANFKADGWQWAADGTVEIPIEGEWCIFSRTISTSDDEPIFPENVLQFMATVEEADDDFITVNVDFDVAEKFGNQIEKGKTYRMSMDAYNPGIYTEKPVKGNVVCVFCKGPVDDTSNPGYIAGVYMITPFGSSPMQPVE